MIEFREFEQKDEALLVSYLNDEAQTQFLSARLPQPYTNEAARNRSFPRVIPSIKVAR